MSINTIDLNIFAKRKVQVLHDKKWNKFLKKSWIFRSIPFITIVFASGSMALGNVSKTSDFDVIVGTRYGRMFTARFFAIITLSIFGWRRKNLDHGASAADTICLNHFVTEKSYTLSPPHQTYWKELYANLVPIWGSKTDINMFQEANATWVGESHDYHDLRWSEKPGTPLQYSLEKVLNGKLGNILERRLKKIQLERIEKKIKPKSGYKPRLICSDVELELHLDTRRIEMWTTIK
jgi:hypothetical protein